MNRTVLGALLGLAMSAPVTADEFYKWKDAEGVTHYSKEKPRGQEVATVRVLGAPASGAADTAPPPPPAAEIAVTAPAGAAPPTKLAPKAEELLAARKANCDNAQANAATLRSYNEVTLDKDGDGVAEPLTEEEHREQLERAEAQIETFCDRK